MEFYKENQSQLLGKISTFPASPKKKKKKVNFEF